MNCDAATARHDALTAQIDSAISAESARWGDLLRPNDPYTREGDWLDEIENITDNYLTARPGISFNQMKSDDLSRHGRARCEPEWTPVSPDQRAGWRDLVHHRRQRPSEFSDCASLRHER